MLKKIEIRQIHTEALSCEPLLERTANGELLCVCQCGGVTEPAPENRVYAFHSTDNGRTWSRKESIYPEDGRAVYCTELSVNGNEITAYLTIHSGRFLHWECVMMKSYDNGYTWENAGPPPHFPEYTFVREHIRLSNGDNLISYHTYPVKKEDRDAVYAANPKAAVWETHTEYCESGVLLSGDGKNFDRYPACRFPLNEGWIWSEPTVAELSDGTLAMLMRKCRSGWLWRCESKDGGRTWSDAVQTDIPNPSNKPRLFKLNDGRIALVHTPNNAGMGTGKWAARYPYALWISDDDLQSFSEKTVLTDFPGAYSYTDGIVEENHIRLVVEHNRHTILFFDIEL